ncbi:MAG: hypothetical protein K2Y29_11585, partial [Beijerinckiaceae bacterium]|nr:hypothetical protein [Beijerinckiaceae bacterium]
MAKRVTPAQYNAMVRRYNQEVDRVNRGNRAAAEKAVREYNREVDRINQHNRRVTQEINRQIARDNQKRRNAVNKYNQAVRNHNFQVGRERQRRISALRSLTSTRYADVRNSSLDLSDWFDRINTGANAEILVAAERESTNSAAVAYILNASSEALVDVAQ